MTRLGHGPRSCLPGVIAGLLLASATRADVILDGSLGPRGQVPGAPNYEISHHLGQQWGGNLLFSFSRFDLAKGESATFTGPGTVENILSRVTGGSPSLIDGLIRTQFPGSHPNLYFINPYGITFGPNAKLDVQGSFHATTASYVKLGVDKRFDALHPEASLLAADPPSAFGFVGKQPASIDFQGSQMAVAEGRTWSVTGGDIRIAGASKLTAPSGRFEAVSLASPGTVRLGDAKQPPASDGAERHGEVAIVEGSTVDVSGTGSGGVYIRAGRFVVEGTEGQPSSVRANAQGSADSQGIEVDVDGELTLKGDSALVADAESTGRGGNITVRAKDISLDGWSCLCTRTGNKTTSSGAAGDITVAADSISLTRGGGIRSETRGSGDSGSVNVTATSGIHLDGAIKRDDGTKAVSTISTLTHGSGHGGDVHIETRKLTMMDRGVVTAATFGPGQGGNIDIDAKSIRIEGLARPVEDDTLQYATGITSGSVKDTNSPMSPSGRGGNVHITADQITLRSGGVVSAEAQGTGAGGNVSVEVHRLDVSGHGFGAIKHEDDRASRINAETRGYDATASAGRVEIKAGRVLMSDGGQIEVGAYGPGKGGEVKVQAGRIDMSGGYINQRGEWVASGISALSVNAPNAGNGGHVQVLARHLHMNDRAEISSSTAGSGKAGPIEVHVAEMDVRNQAKITASTDGLGGGGDIDLRAGKLGIGNGGEISTSTSDAGQAGDIRLRADQVDISHGGRLVSESSDQHVGAGNAGGITLDARRLTVTDGGAISVSSRHASAGSMDIDVREMAYLRQGAIDSHVARGPGHGGDIRLSARYTILDGSRVLGTSDAGPGGHVFLGGGYLFQTPRSQIDASSVSGADGRVVYGALAPDTAISSRLTRLETPYSDPADKLSERCSERTPEGASSFVVKGRYRPGFAVDGWLQGDYASATLRHGRSRTDDRLASANRTPPLFPPLPSTARTIDCF